MSIVVVKQFNC